jgi:hypothetical protein
LLEPVARDEEVLQRVAAWRRVVLDQLERESP